MARARIFSKWASTGLLFSTFGKECLWWQESTLSSPVAPAHANYPRVPTLVLDGDLDNQAPLEDTRKVSTLFPDSTWITVAGVGHLTVGWTQCASDLVSEFVETLRVTDASCASIPKVTWPAVGRFPVLSKDARPASIDPKGANEIGLAERKVVTVTVAAATDALQRSLIGLGNGVGLRSGTFHTDYAVAWTTTLMDCSFAADVMVSGTVTWRADNSLVARLTVSGPGTAGGYLRVEGSWEASGPVRNFKVSGALGGKRVAVIVPEA